MDKQSIRELVWTRMEAKGVATFPRPVRGRIPNFKGSRQAAMRLRSLPVYRSAKTVFVNPDAPQLPVREVALRDGKRVIMATPKLQGGFIALDPAEMRDVREAASIRGALRCGNKTDVCGLKVNLVIEGSVAVDRKGGRLGKSRGFGDMEVAILREADVITDTTPIVTTVHPIQIVNEVPMSEHDAPVDLIVIPDRIIETAHTYQKPRGIIWKLLPSDAFKQMPILAELRGKR